MKRIFVALLFVFASFGFIAHSFADSIIGKYDGTFTIASPVMEIGVRINIDSQDGQNIKGSVVFYGNFCSGKFPMEGTVVDNVILLTTRASRYCESRNFNLRVEGAKLAGTLSVLTGQMAGEYPVNVSK